MPQLNQLHSTHGGAGLRVIALNFANTDPEIDNFVLTYGATYGLARVADSSGYNVPQFSWAHAIDAQGTILWQGSTSSVTDAMINDWLNPGNGTGDKGSDEDDDGCTITTGGVPGVLSVMLALLWLRRRRLISFAR
ncbi:MAG: hypothetical protein IPK87_08225 [Planctomycetes bacterium]|nr:hypothetical protein [Planctomycetota bacterium]